MVDRVCKQGKEKEKDRILEGLLTRGCPSVLTLKVRSSKKDLTILMSGIEMYSFSRLCRRPWCHTRSNDFSTSRNTAPIVFLLLAFIVSVSVSLLS